MICVLEAGVHSCYQDCIPDQDLYTKQILSRLVHSIVVLTQTTSDTTQVAGS